MRRTELLQEIRKMRFEEAYGGWQSGRLTQGEAALLLGMCERTFRRYLVRFEADGLQGLIDRRLEQVSHKKAPVDEVLRVTETYRQRHEGWSAKHFYAWYRRDGGSRSYTWVKSRLQEADLVPKAKARGVHRKRRDRSPWPGLMIHRKRPAVPPCRIVIYGLSGRSGKSSSIRLLGQMGNFSRVSLSQTCGSRPFSLAVPNRL